jgi:hypothetical protein
MPYSTDFPYWRAWRGQHRFWARLPGTTRVFHADNAAELASQIRSADVGAVTAPRHDESER